MVNILRDLAQARGSQKNQTVYSKKEKLPTAYKTKKQRCSLCGNFPAQKYQISEKVTRILCDIHKELYSRQGEKHKPNFVKASMLYHD